MLNLQFRWLWLGIGGLLVALVCFGSLLPTPRIGLRFDDKMLHFVSYFVLTVWFSGLYARRTHYIVIAAIVIALGAALDVAQATTATRYFEVLDVVAEVRRHLEANGRVSLRMVRRQYELDDDALAEVIDELVARESVR